jgi:hypothetical protein
MIKRPSLLIHGIEERAEIKPKSIENLFNELE